ncbi:MAG: alanine racemase, partial [bacterium]
RAFRRLIDPATRLSVAVKANAYGHGLVPAARAFLAGGADWLCVHAPEEVRALRQAGVTAPIYLLGPVALDDLAEVAALEARLVVYNRATIERLAALGVRARLHLKVETGNHRQGVELPEALALAELIARTPGLELEGVASHFANIEDTTDHRYARYQLARFEEAIAALRAAGHPVSMRHISNSAAALLWPENAFDLIRLGISAYGLWPSRETRVAAALAGHSEVALRPALTWKTRVAQVKDVPEGASIGYGLTYVTSRPTRLAILPVGYADGYDRQLGNLAHVLIGGRRAPVRGRVCMNIIMVDVTDGPAPALEDEVVLLGRQGAEEVSAEAMAGWAGTINYEVVARIAEHVPRLEAPRPLRAVEDALYRATGSSASTADASSASRNPTSTALIDLAEVARGQVAPGAADREAAPLHRPAARVAGVLRRRPLPHAPCHVLHPVRAAIGVAADGAGRAALGPLGASAERGLPDVAPGEGAAVDAPACLLPLRRGRQPPGQAVALAAPGQVAADLGEVEAGHGVGAGPLGVEAAVAALGPGHRQQGRAGLRGLRVHVLRVLRHRHGGAGDQEGGLLDARGRRAEDERGPRAVQEGPPGTRAQPAGRAPAATSVTVSSACSWRVTSTGTVRGSKPDASARSR